MDLEQEQSCSSDVDTDEELLEEKQPAPTTPQRIKSFLRKNWRNVLVLVCLWIAFSLCTAAFSLMTPFFPKEVQLQCSSSSACAPSHSGQAGTVLVSLARLSF